MLGYQKSAPTRSPHTARWWFKKQKARISGLFWFEDCFDQAKLASAKDQFTSLSRKVSTNLGRMLR
jgi:hypothetical protein